ncbi:hypothetical protein [Catellatospora sp. NPDC049609]|uniref:hypothetical protein n=1 Tax=Catellatospora sp. NPDC049609 TaxID=3155505 RepID=UPI0034446995
MTKLDPPPTPAYLVEAVYETFGIRCLLCTAGRPLNVAHLMVDGFGPGYER